MTAANLRQLLAVLVVAPMVGAAVWLVWSGPVPVDALVVGVVLAATLSVAVSALVNHLTRPVLLVAAEVEFRAQAEEVFRALSRDLRKVRMLEIIDDHLVGDALDHWVWSPERAARAATAVAFVSENASEAPTGAWFHRIEADDVRVVRVVTGDAHAPHPSRRRGGSKGRRVPTDSPVVRISDALKNPAGLREQLAL